MFLKLIGYFGYFYLVLEGLSFWIRKKDFDLIAYLFYPDSYGKDYWINLSGIPYWVSFCLGALCIFGPIWLYIKQKIEGEL